MAPPVRPIVGIAGVGVTFLVAGIGVALNDRNPLTTVYAVGCFIAAAVFLGLSTAWAVRLKTRRSHPRRVHLLDTHCRTAGGAAIEVERLAVRATDLLRKYDVMIDHTRVASLSCGDVVTVPVTAGTHDIYSIIGSVDPGEVDTSSNHLTVDCQPDQTYRFDLLSSRGSRLQRIQDGWIILKPR